jgi:hypothetical protein
MNRRGNYWSFQEHQRERAAKPAPVQQRLGAPQPTNCLGDDDPMPFGKFGPKSDDPRTMKDVPPGYLDWLAGQDWIIRWPKVMNCIEWRRGAIDQELKQKERE